MINRRDEAAAVLRLVFWATAVHLGMGVLTLAAQVMAGAAHFTSILRVVGTAQQLSELGVDVLLALAMYRLGRSRPRPGLAWASFGLVILGTGVDLVSLGADLVGNISYDGIGMRLLNLVGDASIWPQVAFMLAALWIAAREEGARPPVGVAVALVVLLGLEFAVSHGRLIEVIPWQAYRLIYTGLAWARGILLLVSIGSTERQLRAAPIWPAQPASRLPAR